MDSVDIVVAHSERATLRVGDVFVKVDSDQQRLDVEVAAMKLVPVTTAEVLWRQPPAVAFARLPGAALARLGKPDYSSAAAWAAAGAAVRRVHDAPLPPWISRSVADFADDLDRECAWLVDSGALPAELVERNRVVATAALRDYTPVFMHGDLQAAHVFVDGDTVTGILDWSETAQGDPLRDLAKMTVGNPERLGVVLDGYGRDVDIDVIKAWWALGSLLAARWLIEHGYDPDQPGCEFDALRAAM